MQHPNKYFIEMWLEGYEIYWCIPGKTSLVKLPSNTYEALSYLGDTHGCFSTGAKLAKPQLPNNNEKWIRSCIEDTMSVSCWGFDYTNTWNELIFRLESFADKNSLFCYNKSI